MPTLDCLVNLTEAPFFVRAINNIELIYFERVHFSIKNFDMAIIYKDFTTVERISSIPAEQLDTLKQWADQSNLIFHEGTAPLNWPVIL